MPATVWKRCSAELKLDVIGGIRVRGAPKAYLPTKRYAAKGDMNGPEIEFDWDEANVGHLARHSVLPNDAEQVVLNDPMDLGMEMVGGEERHLNPGPTVIKVGFFLW